MFAITGLLFAVGLFAEQYAVYGLLVRPGTLPAAEVALWLQTWTYQAALIPMFVLLPLYFPDGSLPSPRWRWVARSSLALTAITPAFLAVAPGDVLLGDSALTNPYGIDGLRPWAG